MTMGRNVGSSPIVVKEAEQLLGFALLLASCNTFFFMEMFIICIEIGTVIQRSPKYMDWEQETTQRSWELQNLKEACETALQAKLFRNNSEAQPVSDQDISIHRAAEADIPTEIGMFDPVTRGPLNPLQLVSNLAVKEAVQAFLDKQGWVYQIT